MEIDNKLKELNKLVVIPTYNEGLNIVPLVERLLALPLQIDILFVDDNSTDETIHKISECMNTHKKKINCLSRKKKEGIGSAYIAGFQWGFQRNYNIIIQMDADLSHKPQYILGLLGLLKKNDFVVGSRNIPGGGTRNWGAIRRFVSKGGNFYSKILLSSKINDLTGGYNAWTSKTLEKVVQEGICSEGYAFQIEIKHQASQLGFRGAELPIIFTDRKYGKSKMHPGIILEAIYTIPLLRLRSLKFWTKKG